MELGTRVNIVNQPYKAGIKDGVIYLEAHPHLDEDASRFVNLTEVVKIIIKVTGDNRYEVDWNLVDKIVAEEKGIPVAIGVFVPEEEEPDDQMAATQAQNNTISPEIKGGN